jgi:polysaccharide biosynthesis/export protein
MLGSPTEAGDRRLLSCRQFACAGFLLAALTACAGGPTGREIIAQARPGGQVSFDVVDIDDAVVTALLARQTPPFEAHFAKYLPPPEVTIAVGDVVSVVIWEATPNGLFGNSLTQLSLPAGASAALRTQQIPLSPASPLPAGLTPSPAALGGLYGLAEPGGAAANPLALAAGAEEAGALGQNAGPEERGAAGMLAGPRTQQLLAATAQSKSPGTEITGQAVGSDGGISIPYAGRIHVAGRTPQQVAQIIQKRLRPIAVDPQVLFVIERSTVDTVAVGGDAVAGKRVALSPAGDRLLQVIAAAGGSKAPVRDTEVRLSRGGVTASVPLATLIADPAQDIYARPGDVLTLQRRPQTFSVLGAAGKNAAINFSRDRLSLAEALAEAGGLLDQQADPRAVFLFRYEPDAIVRALGEPIATDAHGEVSPIVYRLNMKKAEAYLLARRFPVHNKDVIFVADAPSQRVYYFFEALQNITGPVVSGLLACQYATC